MYFEPVLSALLNRLLDENKQVQLSACTAITTMEESASQRIVSYIYSILLQTNRAFALYHRKNRLILYDALGTLADSAKSALNNATYIHLLMPPLITKWNELADNDTDLYPLLEVKIKTIQIFFTFVFTKKKISAFHPSQLLSAQDLSPLLNRFYRDVCNSFRIHSSYKHV